MNEQIKELKKNLLAQLNAQKTNIENGANTLIAQKYAVKKAEVDKESAELDVAYSSWQKQKEEELKAELNAKYAEVQAKKETLIANAQATAKTEAETEIASQVAEYVVEISELEKELAD